MTATWGEVPAIDQNGIVVMYEVQVLPLQLLGMLTTLSINTTNTSVFITALEEYVQYNISVSAYTSVGPGPFSPAVTNRTFEDGKQLKLKLTPVRVITVSLLLQNQLHPLRICRPQSSPPLRSW